MYRNKGMDNVKDNSYITFYGWMRNRLNLKGTQLLVYAVVYSFSHDGVNEYKSNLDWIAEFIGVDVKTIRRALNDLEKKQYIRRFVRSTFYGPKNFYSVNPAFIYKPEDDEGTKCPLVTTLL